jgi:glyoxylase-like metal-dependent hydrolase (beta-lactamase superfamily II)
MTIASARGGPPRLVEVADGVHAYLQHGSWGYSNAGLIASGGRSLLVDTLYDLQLTAHMLSEMRRAVPAASAIGTLVNTHANGDHCWGNQLVQGAEIVSSRAAAAEMLDMKPGMMLSLMRVARGLAWAGPRARRLMMKLGELGVPSIGPLAEAAEFALECFGAFDFRGIQLSLPTRTFEGRLDLTVEDKAVQLLQVGPAHTEGDLLVYLPRERVVFTGDILFIGSHPIVWQGPIRNWIAACDRVLELDVDVVVPGHGPLTDKAGVRETKAYWERVLSAAASGFAASVSADDTARALLREFDGWAEAHRVIANVDAAYRELRGDTRPPHALVVLARMAQLAADA